MSLQDIYKKAGVVMKPAAMKGGKLYSQQPHSGAGDFNFSRADGVQTRINKHGLIESVANNEPRLSYDLVDGKVSDCPYLLLEPSRYNNLQRSEEFENSYWNKSLISVENNHVSPDGSASADKVVSGSSTGAHFFRRTSLNYSASKQTFSIFAKFSDDLFEQFHFVIYDGSNHFAYFDVKNGVIGSADSGIETSMVNYGNGWYRCIATYQTASFSAGQIKVELGNSVTQAGDGDSGMIFWGMMWETGSYATSYIPTSGSTETRQVDICNGSGNSETFNSNEGVLFAEIEALYDDGSERYIEITDGTTSNRVVIRLSPISNEIKALVSSGGANVFSNGYAVSDITETHKVAVKYKQNDFALWIDGVERATDTSGSAPIGLDVLNLSRSGVYFYGKTKELTVINEALTDEQLQLLTTP